MRNAMLSISLRYCFAEKELLLNAREKISFRNRKQAIESNNSGETEDRSKLVLFQNLASALLQLP